MLKNLPVTGSRLAQSMLILESRERWKTSGPLVCAETNRPRIRGTQVKSSVWMKKAQESSKWIFLDNLIPKIESKAPT